MNMRLPLALTASTALVLLAGCGGRSDEDRITDIIKQGGKNPSSICPNSTDALVEKAGGMDACLKASKGSEDPEVAVKSLSVDGDKATAKIHGVEGDQTLEFVKDGDAWKVNSVS
jgi:hypothetical protein